MAACDAASLAMRDPKQAERACARRNLSVRHKKLMCGCSAKRAQFRANVVDRDKAALPQSPEI